ncbi:hypothetical protein [Salinigranum marinum]|uniref:hypothetical protein n=1 Tax=Salinigranum marinum TaxID=1515595 RepID=UPI002989D1FC|nr:hypothetical protein [Salinigranum marinum]
MELVNAVGGGNLYIELDLAQLQKELECHKTTYDPEYHPALKLLFDPDGATVLLFRTGKYNIAGASSIEELQKTSDRLKSEMNNVLQDWTIDQKDCFEIRNLVFVEQLPSEFELSVLLDRLQCGETKYNPEQSQCIFYKPAYASGTFMIFRTGKIILTGESSTANADKSMENLVSELPLS